MIIILCCLLSVLVGICLGWSGCIWYAHRHRMSLALGGGFLPETVYIVPSLLAFLPGIRRLLRHR